MVEPWRAAALTLLLLCAASSSAASSARLYGSVYQNASLGSFYFVPTYDVNAVATGYFVDGLNVTGWGELEIITNAKASDADQAAAAGYLEGILTAKYIGIHAQNIAGVFFKNNTPPAPLTDFFENQSLWAYKMILNHSTSDIFWNGVALVMSQFDGLVSGYLVAKAMDKTLPMLQYEDFIWLNSVGDMLDLLPALSARVDPLSLNPKEFAQFTARHSLCSALLQIAPDFSTVHMGHSSWFVYSSMARIYKHYNFAFSSQAETVAQSVSFSSYGGMLSSLDDYYILSSGLVMLQTTNGIFNTTLYEQVVPTSLLAWQRVRVANMLASSGAEWADLVAQFNSGTYNNQYMVFDSSRFMANVPLLSGALWVVEQIPGLVQSGDQTAILALGHWPSYNVPFYPNVYALSGYPGAVAKYGTSYSYDLAPRAQIFRRDASSVQDIDDFKTLMRYNDYLHDPISAGNPMAAICSRGDLLNPPQYGGCYDTKVTQVEWLVERRADAISSPTYGGKSKLPPFSWPNATSTPGSPHVGLPQKWEFPFITLRPVL
jgi:hypothetical protein